MCDNSSSVYPVRKCMLRILGSGHTTPAIVILLWTLLMMTSESHVLCHVPRMKDRMNWSSTAVAIRFLRPGCLSVPWEGEGEGREKEKGRGGEGGGGGRRGGEGEGEGRGRGREKGRRRGGGGGEGDGEGKKEEKQVECRAYFQQHQIPNMQLQSKK